MKKLILVLGSLFLLQNIACANVFSDLIPNAENLSTKFCKEAYLYLLISGVVLSMLVAIFLLKANPAKSALAVIVSKAVLAFPIPWVIWFLAMKIDSVEIFSNNFFKFVCLPILFALIASPLEGMIAKFIPGSDKLDAKFYPYTALVNIVAMLIAVYFVLGK